MTILLIILGVIVIPPIFNVMYAYAIIKYNLWNEFSEFVLCDCSTNHRMDKSNIISLIIPFVSCVHFIVTIGFYFIFVIYKILKIILYPIVWVYRFIANVLTDSFNKIEDKRGFFEKLNNH